MTIHCDLVAESNRSHQFTDESEETKKWLDNGTFQSNSAMKKIHPKRDRLMPNTSVEVRLDCLLRRVAQLARSGRLPEEAEGVYHDFTRIIAASVLPWVVNQIESARLEGLESKHVVAKRINERLAALGLTLECSAMHSPGILVVAQPQDGRARFELNIGLPNGRRVLISQEDPRFKIDIGPCGTHQLQTSI